MSVGDVVPLPTPGELVVAEEPWYAGGLRFECQEGCTACCTGEGGYVWVSKSEIDDIARHLGIDRATFKRDYCDRYGSRWSIKEKPSGEGHDEKEHGEKGDCHFLVGGKGCSIYPVRPKQCRTFPFWAESISSPEAWEETAQDCPGCNEGLVHSVEQIEARAAVASGRRTMLERLYQRLRDIYAEADAAVSAAGGACALSGRCCDLPRREAERHATSVEVALLVEGREWDAEAMLAARRDAVLEETDCPFLDRGRCAVWEERPLSCRVYSCSSGYLTEEHERILTRFDSEIRRLEPLFGIELAFGELRHMLARRAGFAKRADPLTGRP